MLCGERCSYKPNESGFFNKPAPPAHFLALLLQLDSWRGCKWYSASFPDVPLPFLTCRAYVLTARVACRTP